MQIREQTEMKKKSLTVKKETTNHVEKKFLLNNDRKLLFGDEYTQRKRR